jgi:hypothetical protein
MNVKKWFLGSTAAAVLAVGALGGITAYADSGTPAAPTVAEASESTTPESTTPEVSEIGDPALPGGGHADAASANVDNQFDGVQ